RGRDDPAGGRDGLVLLDELGGEDPALPELDPGALRALGVNDAGGGLAVSFEAFVLIDGHFVGKRQGSMVCWVIRRTSSVVVRPCRTLAAPSSRKVVMPLAMACCLIRLESTLAEISRRISSSMRRSS